MEIVKHITFEKKVTLAFGGFFTAVLIGISLTVVALMVLRGL
jgi:hypothetical protein